MCPSGGLILRDSQPTTGSNVSEILMTMSAHIEKINI